MMKAKSLIKVIRADRQVTVHYICWRKQELTSDQHPLGSANRGLLDLDIISPNLSIFPFFVFERTNRAGQ